jgi:hypothetical protein
VIPREAFCNKLHELKYSFKRQADRVCLYKRPNDPHYVTVPRRDLLDEQYVRRTLQQCGCRAAEIEAFIVECRRCH